MFKRQWTLVATPHEDDPVLEQLAEAFSRSQTFFFRWSAKQAAWFYESRLYLPLHFYVVRVDE